MDEKRDVELSKNYEEDVIYENTQRYGIYCEKLAMAILRNEEDAKRCVDECYQRIVDTIRIYRPQNFKAYLCKVVRNHALNQKSDNENIQSIIAELKECMIDIVTAEESVYDEIKVELTYQAFLKELEDNQRKIFLARYWWFASVSEIASLYCMSERKVEKILLYLRQKFQVVLEQDEILLYAMTEIEDKYLDESVLPEEGEVKRKMQNLKWRNGTICAFVSILILVFIVMIVPKNLVGQLPVGTETEGFVTEGTTSEGIELEPDGTVVDLSSLIFVPGEGTFIPEGLEEWKSLLPWNQNKEVATLPVYKNLAYVSPAGQAVYLSEEELLAKAKDIAEKLNTEITSYTYQNVYMLDGSEGDIGGIEANTDLGYISIDGRGMIYVVFQEVSQPWDEDVSYENIGTETANEMVRLCIQRFSGLWQAEELTASSYAVYTIDGQKIIFYRAVEAGHGMDGILGYYFNQVNFYFDTNNGLVSFRYGDPRETAGLVGYYPIISYEEAKKLLLAGHFLSTYDTEESDKIALPTEANIRFAELRYTVSATDAYYMPYYRFYMQMGETAQYSFFDVPAVKGADLDRMPPESEVEIMDIKGYDRIDDLVYIKDGKSFTIENGQIVETESVVTQSYYEIYGRTNTEYGTEGAVTYFSYGDSKVLNLTELMPEKDPESLSGMYIDGKVVVIYRDNSNVTCYWYSESDKSLTKFADNVPGFIAGVRPFGLVFNGGRYATWKSEEGKLMILDLFQGDNVDTGISTEYITSIRNAGDDHYAVIYKTGEVAVVEKESGKKIKTSKYHFDVEPDKFKYKDGILYADFLSEDLIYVISEFE